VRDTDFQYATHRYWFAHPGGARMRTLDMPRIPPTLPEHVLGGPFPGQGSFLGQEPSGCVGGQIGPVRLLGHVEGNPQGELLGWFCPGHAQPHRRERRRRALAVVWGSPPLIGVGRPPEWYVEYRPR